MRGALNANTRVERRVPLQVRPRSVREAQYRRAQRRAIRELTPFSKEILIFTLLLPPGVAKCLRYELEASA